RPEELLLSHEIGQQMEILAHLRDRLDLEFSELGGVFAATGEAGSQGSKGPVEWVRHHCKLSTTRASELMVVGGHVAQMPESCDALNDGEVGFGHLVQIARNARFCAKSRTAHFDERPLLEKAVDESVSRFRHTCLAMRHSQDPEGYVDSEVNAVESRELLVYPQDDGMTLISARLDSTGAATVQTALKALSKKLGPDDYRTSARRDADALIEIALYMLNEGAAPEGGSQRPHISVTCTLETLMGLKGAPAAQIEYGQPISGATLNRLACDSEITKVLLDDRLIPVAVGHMKRTLTKAERRALNARDGGCRYPCCHRPPSQCEAHHIEFYSRGGKTKLDNMMLLCPFHHWRIHEGGWLLGMSADGSVVVVPPQLARGPGSIIAA
ncbi:MAG: DUF222 domain-containing protein, partial [Candidatus Dormibacteria bacterium]